METIKLTEEELKEITEIQTLENNYMVQLGQIEYQIQSLNIQKSSLQSTLVKFETRKNNLGKVLQDKYGEGSINVETGEFTKNS